MITVCTWYGAIHEEPPHPLDRVNVLVSVNTSIQAPTLFTVSSSLCASISISARCLDFSVVATGARGSESFRESRPSELDGFHR